MNKLVEWLIATLAVGITAYLLPGVIITGFIAAFITAIVIGIINTFIRPVIILLTLPLNIVTLGLFTLVINAFLILLASLLVPGFAVLNFWWALLFSIILSLVNFVLKGISNNTNPNY